jgi:hypothetical protein
MFSFSECRHKIIQIYLNGLVPLFSNAFFWAAIGDDAVTIYDYVAISVLVVSAVWAVADWLPRGKL